MSSYADEVATTLDFYVGEVDGPRPYSRLYDDGSGTPAKNYALKAHTVNVENVRDKVDLYKLDEAGFQYFTHRFQDLDFEDASAIEAEFFPEAVKVVKDITGASKIVVFEHLVRRHSLDTNGGALKHTQPAKRFAHVDQTTTAAISRVYRHFPLEEASQLLQKRFQIVNLWRPISNPALDCPLTLCDYRSINPLNDLVPMTLVYPDGRGEISVLRYNPDHRWRYLRGMGVDEFVLFKCFDSNQQGDTALMVPHAAFEDPSTPEGAPLRQSIEVRMLLFYE